MMARTLLSGRSALGRGIRAHVYLAHYYANTRGAQPGFVHRIALTGWVWSVE